MRLAGRSARSSLWPHRVRQPTAIPPTEAKKTSRAERVSRNESTSRRSRRSTRRTARPKNEHLYNLADALSMKGDRKAALELQRYRHQPRGKAGRDAERYAKIVAEDRQATRGPDDDATGERTSRQCRAGRGKTVRGRRRLPRSTTTRTGSPTPPKVHHRRRDKDGVQTATAAPPDHRQGRDRRHDQNSKERGQDGVQDDGFFPTRTRRRRDGFAGSSSTLSGRPAAKDGGPESAEGIRSSWEGVGVAGAGWSRREGRGLGPQASSARAMSRGDGM